jgi:branched-chain amino acid aminotransferase
MADHDVLVWINGGYVPKSKASVSILDHGLLYGDGVFEGIKSWDGMVFKLKEHIERFYESAHFLNIELPWTEAQVVDICLNTLAANDLGNGTAYIRLVATRGPGDLGINPRKCSGNPTLFCLADKIQLYPEELYRTGLNVVTCATRRNSVQSLPARVKSLNYVNNILGVMEANHAGADEGIMLTQEGYVGEATADNIFFAKDGVVKTPAKHLAILAGITRESIIDIARMEGFEVEEGTYLTFDLYNADEVWLTGTGADLIPVVEIDTRRIGSGKPGPIFEKLRGRWMDYVRRPENHSKVPAKDSVLVGV